MASFNYSESRARDVGLSVDHSEQLPDSICTCDVDRGYYMFLLFFGFVFCFRDSNMTSIGTAEFRYCVVIIILVDLRKP